MHENLLEISKKYLSDKVISQIASAVGMDESTAKGVIGKVFPSLLGLFGEKASSSEGAAEVFDTLQKSESGMLDNVSDFFNGDQTETITKGQDLLGGLFGDKLGSLSGILEQIPGLGKGKIGSLMGLLTPILTGILGKQVASNGLNASGLASLLSSQKQHIQGALGSDFTNQLGFASLAGGSSAQVAQSATETSPPVKPIRNTSSQDITSGGGSHDNGGGGFGLGKLLIPLLLGLLAFFGFKMCSGSKDGSKEADQGTLLDQAAEAGNSLKDGATNMADKANNAVGGAADSLGNAAGNLKDGAANMADKANNAIGGAADSLGNAAGNLKDGAANMADKANNAIGGAADSLGNAAGNLKDGAANMADKANNAIGGATDAIGETMKKTFSFVPQVEGADPAPALSENVQNFAQKLRALEGAGETAYGDFSADGKSRFLYRIPFATGETGVPESHQKALINKLKQAGKDGTLITIGYADTRGDDALNHRLSYGRAKEVGAWIKSTVGEDASLESFSMGETDRFSKSDFSKNRVVEVWQVLP